MKVNGQLELAQLEQIASTSPTPVPTGRMYIDVTTPTAGIPKIYNGTSWRTIQLGQTSAAISQNSGKAVTVDWSTGLVQKVVLTDNCVISFSNPVSGSEHTLIVVQSASANYCYMLGMSDQDTHREAYQPKKALTYGNTATYKWLYVAGIKSAVTSSTTMGGGAPLTAPPTLITGMDLSPDGKTLSAGRTSSPYNLTYDITDADKGSVSPFGLQNITTPATLAAQAVGISYGLDGKSVFTVGGSTPYIQGWLTNRGSSLTVLPNPGVLPTGAGRCINIHPTGFFVGVGHTTSPNMSVYPYDGAAWGTKLTDPATLPVAAVTALAWSPQGDYLTVANGPTTPFIQTYAFSISGGVGTIGAVASNPASLPSAGPAGSLGRALAWRPQGDYIAMASTSAVDNYLYVVGFNRTTGAYGSLVTVTSVPAAAVTCLAWSPDGQYLVVGCGTTPFLYIYDFSSATLGTVATIGVNPGQQVNEIVMHPSGDYMFLGLNASPYIFVQSMPTKVRNYSRIAGP